MAGSRRFGTLGFAVQSAEGTAATAPLYTVPVLDGQVGPQKDWGDLPRLGSSLARLGRFTQRARVGGVVQMLLHPEAIGPLLAEVCGAESVSVAPAPYTHRFTISDSIPAKPMTVWSSVGTMGTAGSVFRNEDCWVQRLSFQGTSGENIIAEVEFIGKKYVPVSTIPAVQTGPPVGVATNETPRMKYIGSVLQLDADGTAVADVVANSMEFEIDRAPDVRYGQSLTPLSIAPDRMVNFSCGVDWDSAKQAWDFLLASFVGTTGGTAPSQLTALGAFKMVFGRHPADPTRLLTILSGGDVGAVPVPQQNWDYTMERPSASGEPDALTYDLDGIAIRPTTGTSEVQIMLQNDFATVYV